MSEIKPQVGDEYELFQQHDATLLKRTKRVTQITAEDAEDAVAFAWMQLIRKQPDRGGTNILAWLTVVAKNRALDLRQERLDKRTVDVVDEARFVLDPRDLTAARNAVLDARDHLAAIPESNRKALVMHGLGFDQREIAAELGTTPDYEKKLEALGLDRIKNRQVEMDEEAQDAPPRVKLLAELRRSPPDFLRLELGRCPRASLKVGDGQQRLRWAQLALRIIDHRVERGITDPVLALGRVADHPRDETRSKLERDISQYRQDRNHRRDRGVQR